MSRIPWSYRLHRLTWMGLDLLFPPVCAGCGKLGSRWCQDCQPRVPRIHPPFCATCGIPMKASGLCAACRSDPPRYRAMRSWAVFGVPLQNALHTIKYRRNIGLADRLALQMVEYVRSLGLAVDLVIPVPLGRQRLKERGYNQIGLVARPLAYELGIQYAPGALRKTRETRTQVGLSVSERRDNVDDAYEARIREVKDRSVLLMDDVATTGATAAACTEALLAAGARDVYVLTIARALAHHDLNRV